MASFRKVFFFLVVAAVSPTVIHAFGPNGQCINGFCQCSHGRSGGILLGCSNWPNNTLDLRMNFLTGISPSAFTDKSIVNINILYLENNLLTTFNLSTFAPLQELSSLFLSYNKFQEIDPSIFSENPLEYLYLNDNSWDCTSCLAQKLAQLPSYGMTKTYNAAYCANTNPPQEISSYSGNCHVE